MFLYLGKILLQFIGRAIFHIHIGFVTRLLGSLVENVAYVFGLDIHLQFLLGVVHHHIAGISTVDILLELRIGGIRLGSTAGSQSE